GTGKTMATRFFVELGCTGINVDEIGHSLILKGREPYKKIVKKFGTDILNEKKEIDRRKLAEAVFKSDRERKYLENILHPLIKKQLKKEIKNKIEEKPWVVVDFPLLFEMKMEKDFDFIVTIYAASQQQMPRARLQGLGEEDARRRIDAQISLKEKCRRSDFVLRNETDSTELKQQVGSLLQLLREKVHFLKKKK
ncbi:MAG TPA: dephospho-CoA kinase, partial [bacterium]|nr:dephospho-CoA kinase [bacterium]